MTHSRLAATLTASPLVFEPVPPTARSSTTRSEKQVAEVTQVIQENGRIDAINVPELVDENHEGRPYYRSGDPRAFARTLATATNREAMVNRIVAYADSVEALERWAIETLEFGVHHLVLVGGSSRYIPYPGPPVVEANLRLAPIVRSHHGLLGNIVIPQRTGEPYRLLAKGRAGASFLTTQILFDADATVRLVREYDTLCRRAGVSPATVLLSFAPIADDVDAEFVRWLGAELPDPAEDRILEGEESGAAARSIANAVEVWQKVVEESQRHSVEVPLGVNVEQVSARHLLSAADMAREFGRILPARSPKDLSVANAGGDDPSAPRQPVGS